MLAAARARHEPAGVTGEAADEVRVLVPDIETLARRLADVDYLVDEGLATSMFLGVRLPQPLLLEGEAGVGKTEAAKALAAVLRHAAHPPAVLRGDRRRRGAVRVELPPPAAQHPARRLARRGRSARRICSGPDYLIRRPLLRALEHPGPRPAVLLIDEIDRADDDFEAFLLELLADASVTIPEIGTIAATHPPIIVLTSNRTRDLHDAVKRRCLYHWIDYPSPQRAVEIVRRRVKGSSQTLAVQVADAVSRMRESRRAEAAGDRGGDRLALGPEPARRGAPGRRGGRSHPRLGAEVRARTRRSIRAAGLEKLVGSGD